MHVWWGWKCIEVDVVLATRMGWLYFPFFLHIWMPWSPGGFAETSGAHWKRGQVKTFQDQLRCEILWVDLSPSAALCLESFAPDSVLQDGHVRCRGMPLGHLSCGQGWAHWSVQSTVRSLDFPKAPNTTDKKLCERSIGALWMYSRTSYRCFLWQLCCCPIARQ